MAYLFITDKEALETNIERLVKEGYQIVWINYVANTNMYYIYHTTSLNFVKTKEELTLNFPDRKKEIEEFNLGNFQVDFLSKKGDNNSMDNKKEDKEENDEKDEVSVINEIKEKMLQRASELNVIETENFPKIANAKYILFANKGLDPMKCPCDAGNENRYCISPLCQKDIEENGKCHCGCYQVKKEELKEEQSNTVNNIETSNKESEEDSATNVDSIEEVKSTIEEKAKITGTKNYPEKNMYKMSIAYKELRGKIEITDNKGFLFVLGTMQKQVSMEKSMEELKELVKSSLTAMCEKAYNNQQ